MHKIMIAASAFLFSMLLSTSALAQGGYGAPGPGVTAPPPSGPPPQVQQAPAPAPPGQVLTGPCEIVTSNQLIGQNVQTPDGEHLGQISGLMMDAQTGQVGYAVLSSGGVLGIGRKDYVVPWNALEIDPQGTIVLDISPERLREAPAAGEITTYEEGTRIHEFYGVTPYWMEEDTLRMRPQQEPLPWEEPGGRVQERGPESLQDNP
jgi:sporulation protein YlmC with PRC-barrel domain